MRVNVVRVNMVRASLLLLATVAGVESFGYIDPAMMGVDTCMMAMDLYSCIVASAEAAPTGGGCALSAGMCMNDPCAASHNDEQTCLAMDGCNYAYMGAAAGVCSSDPCFLYNDDDAGASCQTMMYGSGCYWYTTVPGYESGFCASDACVVSTGMDQASCLSTTAAFDGSYCMYDDATMSCSLMP